MINNNTKNTTNNNYR